MGGRALRSVLVTLLTAAMVTSPLPSGAADLEKADVASLVADDMPKAQLSVGAALRTARTPGAVKSALLRQLRSLGGASESAGTESAASSTPRVDEWLTAVPSIDGDGRNDLVAVRRGKTVQYVAMRGRDGKRLWRYDTGLKGFAGIAPLRLGSERGLLAIVVRMKRSQNSHTIRWDFTALGADGSRRWTSAYEGSFTYSADGDRIEGLSYPAGVGPLNAEPGDDLAIATYDGFFGEEKAGPVTVETGAATAKLTIIDGARGTATPSAAVASPDWLPDLAVVGDFTADGLRDVVSMTYLEDGETLHVVGHAGVTGTPLWDRPLAVSFVWAAEDAGNTDGDPSSDVLLSGSSSAAPGGGDHVFLLSGLDGALRWRRNAIFGASVRDIDADGAADVSLVSFVRKGGTVGPRYMGVTGGGKVLYDRSYTLNERDGDFSGWGAMIGGWNDIDGDNRTDWVHSVALQGDEETVEEEGVVLAVNGRKAYSGPLDSIPLEAPVDGRGDDMARITSGPKGRTITTVNALTNRVLWRRNLGFWKGWDYAQAADLRGDRDAEVIVTVNGRQGPRSWILSAEKGRILWGRKG